MVCLGRYEVEDDRYPWYLKIAIGSLKREDL